MRFKWMLGSIFFLLTAITAQETEAEERCPQTDLACHDIMNSSQCIANVVIEARTPPTKEAFIKCVEHEGTASNLPGAQKVSLGIKTHTNEDCWLTVG